MKSKISLLLLSCILMPSLALATVYKWVDENNQVHYSERPGKNAVNASRMKGVQSKPPESDSANELDALKSKLKAYEDAKIQKAQDEENKANLAKIAAYNCKVARERYASLERPRAKEKTETGVRIIPEDERQAALAKAKLEINKYCQDTPN